MAAVKVALVANTWTDLAAHIVTLGQHLTVTPDTDDVQLGFKAATAPTVGGQAIIEDQAAEVIVGHNSTFKLWARSTAGGNIVIEDILGDIVLVAPSVALA